MATDRVEVSLGETPDGRRIEVSREIGAPGSAAWDLLTDTGWWPDWGPSVTDVDCEDERIRPGTTGRVRLPLGLWVPFEVTAVDERNYRWTWRVAGVASTGHRVEPAGHKRCRVVFELPLIAGGYVPVCDRALARLARRLE